MVDVNPEGVSYSHFSEAKVSNGPRVEHEDSNVSTSLKENMVGRGLKRNSISFSAHK